MGIMRNSRFRLDEISASRLWLAMLRRVEALPEWLSWSANSRESSENKEKLRKVRGIHNNQRCFIMANGPSLASMDMTPLAREITIGMNRIYLLFDRIPFQPNYYVCSNELVLEQFSHDIRMLQMPKFLNWNRRKLYAPPDEITMFFHIRFGLIDRFGEDPTRSLWGGGTVTYVTLQLAFYLGFSEVILIGLDHNYVEIGTPNTIETRNYADDKSHFHPNYYPKGIKWQLPDLRHSEAAYFLARKAFESDGRRIMDATNGGKCQIFEKVDYYSLF
jgi:hypothetical protein